MAEYIDKSDAETVFREVRKRLHAKKRDYVAIEFLIRDQTLSVAEEVIHAIPAADVVEVVRCKDCKYNNHCMTQNFMEDCGVIPLDRNTFFCADGKRSEDEVKE